MIFITCILLSFEKLTSEKTSPKSILAKHLQTQKHRLSIYYVQYLQRIRQNIHKQMSIFIEFHRNTVNDSR